MASARNKRIDPERKLQIKRDFGLSTRINFTATCTSMQVTFLTLYSCLCGRVDARATHPQRCRFRPKTADAG